MLVCMNAYEDEIRVWMVACIRAYFLNLHTRVDVREGVSIRDASVCVRASTRLFVRACMTGYASISRSGVHSACVHTFVHNEK